MSDLLPLDEPVDVWPTLSAYAVPPAPRLNRDIAPWVRALRNGADPRDVATAICVTAGVSGLASKQRPVYVVSVTDAGQLRKLSLWSRVRWAL